jgi:hypothetical protein
MSVAEVTFIIPQTSTKRRQDFIYLYFSNWKVFKALLAGIFEFENYIKVVAILNLLTWTLAYLLSIQYNVLNTSFRKLLQGM